MACLRRILSLEDRFLVFRCISNGVLNICERSHTDSMLRRSNHFDIYKEHCEKLGIAMNLRAIPDDKASDGLQFVIIYYDGSMDGINILFSQQVLDGVLQPKIPQFTKQGLLEYIIELIVCEDEVCTSK